MKRLDKITSCASQEFHVFIQRRFYRREICVNPNSCSTLSAVIRQVCFSTRRENNGLYCKRGLTYFLYLNIFNGNVHKEPTGYEKDFYVKSWF